MDWSFTVSDAALAFLGAGQTQTETFTVDVTDSQKVTVKQDVIITLTGVNDPPVAVTDVVNVNEDATASVVTRDTGVLGNDTDPDTGDAATLVVSAVLAGVSGTVLAVVAGAATVVHGVYGDLSINADGTYSYTPNDASAEALAQGITADDVFTYMAKDTGGATSSTTLTFHITGQDDAPVIASADHTESASIIAGGGGTDAASGVIHFTDVDLGDLPSGSATVASIAYTDANGNRLTLTTPELNAIEAAFSVTPAGGNTNNGAVDWNYSIADSALGFMTYGETVTLSETVTVSDGHAGGTDTSTVTLAITAGPSPVITSGPWTVNVTEDETLSSNLVVNGDFEIVDPGTSDISVGWSSTGFLYPPGSAAGPHSGRHDASMATFNSPGTLSQTITDVTGVLYHLDFWAIPTSGSGAVTTNNSLTVTWGNQTVVAVNDVPSLSTTNPTDPSQYTEYSADVVGTGSVCSLSPSSTSTITGSSTTFP